MTTRELEGAVALPGSLRPKRSAWHHVGSFLRRKPLGAFGAVIAFILIVVAIFAPFIATDDPYAFNVENKFASPGEGGILGGDKLGRDVFSRLVYGSRISLYVGLVSAFAGGSIGMIIGVASVYFGGKDRPHCPEVHRWHDVHSPPDSGYCHHGCPWGIPRERDNRFDYSFHT